VSKLQFSDYNRGDKNADDNGMVSAEYTHWPNDLFDYVCLTNFMLQVFNKKLTVV
jgi:hypothetical protein